MAISESTRHAIRHLIADARTNRGAGAAMNITVALQRQYGPEAIHEVLAEDGPQSVYAADRGRYPCPTCEGWGTVVPPAGGAPIPCPDPDCPIRTTPKEPQR
jgi:hypothetical protein